METNRLEAFSDGVIAIIITIMVLEMHVPHGTHWADLRSSIPVILSYVMSFIYTGIYWNNHHHMLHVSERINGRILWANLHLLFWMSLIPFTTGWMGENHFAPVPVALYGVILFMTAFAYYLLAQSLITEHGRISLLAKAIGSDFKGTISMVMYATAIGLSFISEWLAIGLYIAVAIMWFIPDPRIEKRVNKT